MGKLLKSNKSLMDEYNYAKNADLDLDIILCVTKFNDSSLYVKIAIFS